MEEEYSWDSYLNDRLLSTNQVSAAGLASEEDGVVYACVAQADENDPNFDKWTLFYKEDYEIEVEDENGNKSKKTINEGQTLLTVFKEGYAPDGVWLGGTKYQFINIEKDLDFEGCTFDVATCAKLKGGLHLVKVPGGNILVVIYDEEKEQDRGNSKIAALTFSKELAESGQ
ncbi:profilin [Plasmodium brasilianum]|uniref:Profilin n=2 Tax=Plasmodium (Plasmodium) TaxID=418103 RepID=A0A1C3KBZ6_PLAMA|nr:profilin, putative [Plasmodium malariae]KAI4839551.1 profilin [Plasmodium brasilianum]SBT71101.1 profilin, putative [Plasmodium malariae]SBT87977.1 profilin, putative [Plasmodium malariae]